MRSIILLFLVALSFCTGCSASKMAPAGREAAKDGAKKSDFEVAKWDAAKDEQPPEKKGAAPDNKEKPGNAKPRKMGAVPNLFLIARSSTRAVGDCSKALTAI